MQVPNKGSLARAGTLWETSPPYLRSRALMHFVCLAFDVCACAAVKLELDLDKLVAKKLLVARAAAGAGCLPSPPPSPLRLRIARVVSFAVSQILCFRHDATSGVPPADLHFPHTAFPPPAATP